MSINVQVRGERERERERERGEEKKLTILDQIEKNYTTNYSSLIIVSYLFILIKIPHLSFSIDTTTQLSMLQQTN